MLKLINIVKTKIYYHTSSLPTHRLSCKTRRLRNIWLYLLPYALKFVTFILGCFPTELSFIYRNLVHSSKTVSTNKNKFAFSYKCQKF